MARTPTTTSPGWPPTPGTVSQALRYDPWGTPRTTVPTGYTPFRFQGSWFDDTTSLSWVVTRWYAPNLGRFISEDSLLGDPIDPPSRHLYAYGQGEPVGTWDPDGRRPTNDMHLPAWYAIPAFSARPSYRTYHIKNRKGAVGKLVVSNVHQRSEDSGEDVGVAALRNG